jgi:hypothetical protein
MPLRKIVSIVEGDGEVTAVPVLLGRLLGLRQCYDLIADRPKNAHSVSNLTKPGGLEKFLAYARKEPDCAAVLVLLDADEDCAVGLATSLALRAKMLSLPFPTAIVCAKCEYEVWFLASLSSISGKQINGRPGLNEGLTYDQPVENMRDAKGWLSKNMPPGRAYKETQDQEAITRLLDFDLVREKSRSFRRLEHAIDELLVAIDQNTPFVTPLLDNTQ